MQLTISTKPINKINTDLLVLFVTESWEKEISILGAEVSKKVVTVAKAEDFKGKSKETVVVDTDTGYKRLLVAGISGDTKEATVFDLQQTIATAMGVVKGTKRKDIAVSIRPAWSIQAVVEAILLSTYTFNKYKSKNEDKAIEKVIILAPDAQRTKFQKGIEAGINFSQATMFARDLVNEPAEVMNPTVLAQTAKDIAGKNKNIHLTLYEKKEIAKLGMNAFLGVSQGSDSPPKFIRLHYKPEGSRKKIVIVGKGITFDTGGLSLKPGHSMETMKCDMAGAAAVLGVFSVISEINVNVEVVGLIAACENMPSGKALRPGDILKAMNGKTIEVLNTDAEGRLTLADVLSFAVLKEKPDGIIDLATLTGAMMVALGEDITGLFGNDNRLIELLKKAANEAGEPVWHMPLPVTYLPLIKSNIADLRNTSKGKYGGAITAALFLQEFVGKTPWVHLDIAGPAFAEKNTPLAPYGGTGFGVRLLLRLLTNY